MLTDLLIILVWWSSNIINHLRNKTYFSMMAKCHKGILQCHGQGIDIDYEPDEVKMSCLTVYRTKKQPKS